MGSDSIPLKTLLDESIHRGLVGAHHASADLLGVNDLGPIPCRTCSIPARAISEHAVEREPSLFLLFSRLITGFFRTLTLFST